MFADLITTPGMPQDELVPSNTVRAARLCWPGKAEPRQPCVTLGYMAGNVFNLGYDKKKHINKTFIFIQVFM